MTYSLDEVLLLCLLAVLAGADTFVDIARLIAIDGKTLRRSHHGKGGKVAIHMVSAFAARQRLVLGRSRWR